MSTRFKKVREGLGITQEIVHEQLGISVQRLSGYENGRREPNLETLVMLADYYGVSIDYLIGRETDSCELPSQIDWRKFGKRLQGFREQRQISLEDIAQKLDVPVEYMISVENGTEIPKMDFCMNALNILNISPNAAFMDVSSEGYKDRANYIRDRAEALTPNERERFLEYQEHLLQMLEKEKDGK